MCLGVHGDTTAGVAHHGHIIVIVIIINVGNSDNLIV